jgi:hypothetical protein
MIQFGFFAFGVGLLVGAAMIGCRSPAPYGYGPNAPPAAQYSTAPTYPAPTSSPYSDRGVVESRSTPTNRFRHARRSPRFRLR